MSLKHFVIAVALAFPVSAAAQTSPPPASPPPACTEPEHRQFDFWVGRWDVYRTGQSQRVASSLIEKLYGGCVVRENWMPANGNPGGSLNHYDRGERRWHQTWMDSSNSRVVFEGGMVGDKMVLSGFWKGVNGPGQDGIIRMTYSKGADGSVRQLGEISTDHGLSWGPSFDFTYRPAVKR